MNGEELSPKARANFFLVGVVAASRGFMVHAVALNRAKRIGVDNLEPYDDLETIIRKLEIFCEKNRLKNQTEEILKEMEKHD